MHIRNRRAYHDFSISDTLEAGIRLSGAEVKSIKGGRIILTGAFVRIVGDEIFLVNAEIPLYSYSRPEGYDPRRTRKLLLHKKQIMHLKGKMTQSNLTLVPVACYTKRSLVKLEIGIARGKKEFEKREALKRRDIQRETEKEVRRKD